jgi:hypothetical protein
MSPEYKVIIRHPSIGEVEIKEPLGKKTFSTVLEREPVGKSLIERFEGDMAFYGNAYGMLIGIESNYGPAAKVEIEIYKKSGSQDEFTLLRGAKGLLAIEKPIEGFDKELRRRTIQYPFVMNDFWSKFAAHTNTKVNVQSTEDIFGTEVAVTAPEAIPLPSQIIDQQYMGVNNFNIHYASFVETFGVIDFLTQERVEITNYYTYTPGTWGSVRPFEKFAPIYKGELQLNGILTFTDWSPFGGSPDVGAFPSTTIGKIKVYIQKNDEAAIEIAGVNRAQESVGDPVPPPAMGEVTDYTINETLNVVQGDLVRIYFEKISAFGGYLTMLSEGGWEDVTTLPAPLNSFGLVNGDMAWGQSYLNVTFASLYKDSSTLALTAHDVGLSILNRIAGAGRFKSNFLGHPTLTEGDYTEAGCGSKTVLMKGYHLRGYSFEEKSFFESWVSWFNGLSSNYNLGFGYIEVDGQDVIEVEALEDFFDDSPITQDFFPSYYQRTNDEKQFVKSVKLGCQEYKPETVGGVTVPQGQMTYLSKLERFGNDLDLTSEYISGDILIEETRRQSREKDKDWKLDNSTFILAVNNDLEPELDEGFEDITGIPHSGTRYNYRFWPIWSLLRHLNHLSNGLQAYLNTFFTFSSGDGNYKASATMLAGTDCVAQTNLNFAQDGAVPLNVTKGRGDFLHSHELYDFEIPMTIAQFEAIDRKKGIGIAGVLHFIESAKYMYEDSLLIGRGWPKPGVLQPGNSWQWESGDFVQWESGQRVTHENL